MSAKSKKSKRNRKHVHSWEVRKADVAGGGWRMIPAAELTCHPDGGHVFRDRKGIIASFAPGALIEVVRFDPQPLARIEPVPGDELDEAGLRLPARDRA